jgi:hypothetical protein
MTRIKSFRNSNNWSKKSKVSSQCQGLVFFALNSGIFGRLAASRRVCGDLAFGIIKFAAAVVVSLWNDNLLKNKLFVCFRILNVARRIRVKQKDHLRGTVSR